MLRVVPLFETLDDLEYAETAMRQLFSTPWYFEHIQGKQVGLAAGEGGLEPTPTGCQTTGLLARCVRCDPLHILLGFDPSRDQVTLKHLSAASPVWLTGS